MRLTSTLTASTYLNSTTMPYGTSILYDSIKLIAELRSHEILHCVCNFSFPFHLLTVCLSQHLSHLLQGVLCVLGQGGENVEVLVDVIATGAVIGVEEKTAEQAKGGKREIIEH